MRCLIVQNRLGPDGRSRCVAELVGMLNEIGVEPRIVSVARQDPDIGRTFGLRGLRYSFSQPLRWPSHPSAHNLEVLVTNLVAGKVIRDFQPDLVFNSNNVWNFLPPGPRYLHYFHGIPLQPLLHQIEREKSGFWRAYAAVISLFSRDVALPPGSRLVANSQFVREAVVARHSWDVGLIYPPAWSGELRPGRPNARRVVTLASFHPVKRQLEQVEIARHLPDWKFRLLGSQWSAEYARKVQRAALDVPNVEVILDPTRQRINDEFAQASHFVHTARPEHFGIVAVEAAAAGCVPVVVDAGGIREIVEPEELRFTTVAGCVNALLLSAGDSGCALLHTVQQRLFRFSAAAYRTAMKALVLETATA